MESLFTKDLRIESPSTSGEFIVKPAIKVVNSQQTKGTTKMKKTMLLILVFLLTATSVFSQNTENLTDDQKKEYGKQV